MKRLIIGLILLATSQAGAATIHVPADQPTIQAGIDAAASSNDVLYVRGTSYFPDFDSLLDAEGYSITYSDFIPEPGVLAQYGAVLVNSYPPCNATTAGYLREYLLSGGGVALISGTPWAFSGGTNLSLIQEWFGAATYLNSGGLAFYEDNPAPFETGLVDGDLLLDVTGTHSDAAVIGMTHPDRVLGYWADGTVFAFWNTYGDGRLYYNAAMLSGRSDENNGRMWVSALEWLKGVSCCLIRGDVNHDGVGPDITDVVHLVGFMFQSGPEPPCYEDDYYPETDVNGDLTGPDISDLVYLVAYLFSGGPEPVECE